MWLLQSLTHSQKENVKTGEWEGKLLKLWEENPQRNQHSSDWTDSRCSVPRLVSVNIMDEQTKIKFCIFLSVFEQNELEVSENNITQLSVRRKEWKQSLLSSYEATSGAEWRNMETQTYWGGRTGGREGERGSRNKDRGESRRERIRPAAGLWSQTELLLQWEIRGCRLATCCNTWQHQTCNWTWSKDCWEKNCSKIRAKEPPRMVRGQSDASTGTQQGDGMWTDDVCS